MPYRTRKAALIRTAFFRPLVASLLLLVGACEQGPVTRVSTTTGAEVDLSGPEWLVVNYWAEWCGPCRHEIPELNELDGSIAVVGPAAESQPVDAANLVGVEGLPVSVLGVNYDGLVDEKLAQVSERMGISFAVLAADPRERWGQPIPTVLPSTYLIAPGGEFVETLVGPQTRAGIISRIETLAAARE